jgi:hypothetical protein
MALARARAAGMTAPKRPRAMTLARLEAVWDERDSRYGYWRARPTEQSIEAARVFRRSEAGQIEHPDDRDLALARLAMWRGGSS